MRSLPKSDRVYAEVGTYLYGEGETERPAKKNWPISARTLKNCMPLCKWTGLAGTALDLWLRCVARLYREPESELETEDDLEL